MKDATKAHARGYALAGEDIAAGFWPTIPQYPSVETCHVCVYCRLACWLAENFPTNTIDASHHAVGGYVAGILAAGKRS